METLQFDPRLKHSLTLCVHVELESFKSHGLLNAHDGLCSELSQRLTTINL